MDVLPLLPPWLQLIIIAVLSAISAASVLTGFTSTPAPNTVWGRIYSVIEALAVVTDKAKQVGVPIPTVADWSRSLTEALSQAAASGKPIDPASLASAVGIQLLSPKPAPDLSSVAQTGTNGAADQRVVQQQQ